MTKIYYLAIIECENDKFNEASAREFSHALKKLKASVENRGEIGIWQVKDETALQRFKAELKRLNS